MMPDETTYDFTARASGSVGCEILDPDGEVVAWTVDGWWAAVIVGLPDEAEERSPYRYRSETRPPRSR